MLMTMNKKSKVSVIIPAYNADRFVKEAVASALAQTYKKIEVIVIDDGSTDNTRAILQPYLETDKIKYIHQSNKGLAAARNTGIKNSSGEYIALLDADDIFLPLKIEKQIDYFEKHPECDICYCDLYHFWDDEPEKLFKLNYRYYSGDEVLPNLLKKDFIAPLTMVIRKSVFEKFGGFDENFRRSEDLEFLFRVLSAGVKICFLNDILAKLRLRRTDNLQSFQSQPEVKRTVLATLERLESRLSQEEIKKLQMEKYLTIQRLKIGLAYLENGNKKEAREFIPGGQPRGYILWFLALILPAPLLAKLIRYYHLRKQKSNLIPVK